MEFSCEKALLLSAILNVSRAIPARSSVSALEGIFFETDGNLLKLCGYNLEVGIQEVIEADIVTPGSVVVASRLLTEIVRRLPDDRVTFLLSETMVMHISCGRAVYEISACLEGESYPRMPFVQEEGSAELSQRMLRDMIRGTLFAVSENDTKTVHMGSKFSWDEETLTVVSIDGYRLALWKQQYEGTAPQEDFVVPGTALREVERLLTEEDKTVRLVLGNKHICFEFGDVTLTTRLLEGDFINYMSTIPAEQPISVSMNMREFEASIERVSLLIHEKIKNPIRIKLEKNSLYISCITALGSAKDYCSAQVEGLEQEAEGMEIGFNHRYLLEALRALPAQECIIRLSNPLSPCVIVPREGNAFLHMILPVRLRADN